MKRAGLNNTIGPSGPTRYIQDVQSESSRKHILRNTHGTFSRTDQTLGHKTRANKLKKGETISSVFSTVVWNYKRIKEGKLEIRKCVKTKQHPSEQPLDQRRNQKKHLKMSEANKNRNKA